MIATIADTRFGYDDAGDGLPVVFLHGFPHDRTLWSAQRRALSPQVRTIVPDLRGFGDTTADGPYSLDQSADDVMALLDTLGVERVVVCGLSMGGYLAMALWRRYPRRIRGMILCSTKATADTPEARSARDDAMAEVASGGVEVFAERQLAKMVGRTTMAERPGVARALCTMMARQPAAGVIGTLGALRDRPDSRETLGSITVPTLIVAGDEDVITPLSDANAMLALLPAASAARLEIIPGAGHAVCMERPAAVTYALHEFLAPMLFERE